MEVRLAVILRAAAVVMILVGRACKGALEMAGQCNIFCHGPLLHAVQTSGIFEDSKEFVDMPLRHSPEETLKAFDKLQNRTTPAVLKQFLHEYFREPGTELEACHPPDFTKYPRNFDRIRDPLYRQWALEIHAKWRTLCRRVMILGHWHKPFPLKSQLLPDKTSFFLWGTLMEKVYANDPKSVPELENNIRSETALTSHGLLARVFQNFEKRLYSCLVMMVATLKFECLFMLLYFHFGRRYLTQILANKMANP